MNIEIANRLVELRKKSGLSQEELSEKLGISRQAVSKWERAEASPDTDNLICLAKLYGVSLDELLDTEQPVEEIIRNQKDKEEEKMKEESKKEEESNEEYVNLNDSGIHIKGVDKEVHIDNDGIHFKRNGKEYTYNRKNGSKVYDENGNVIDEVRVKARFKDIKRVHRYHVARTIASSLVGTLCLVAYIVIGCLTPANVGWASYWVLLLVPPVVFSVIEALYKKSFTKFNITILVTIVYCFIGIRFGLWHPYWALWFAIPAWYTMFGPIDKAIKENMIKEGALEFSIHGKDDDEDEESLKEKMDDINID